MIKIKREAAASLLCGLVGDSTFFSVDFIKKNGELRHMNCRKGVTKYLTGAGRKYNPADYDLITVYDIVKKNYRNISLKTIQRMKMHGNEYQIVA